MHTMTDAKSSRSQESCVESSVTPSSINKSKLHAIYVPNTVHTTYASVPWYVGKGTDSSLRHHKMPEKQKNVQEGQRNYFLKSNKPKRWRPGCCSNCGAPGHNSRECVEPPRKIGAKYTDANLQRGQRVQKNEHLTFETKHDRWTGASVDEVVKPLLSENSKYHTNILNKRKIEDKINFSGREDSDSLKQPASASLSLRDCSDLPIYMTDNLVQYDPRTHAAHTSVFSDSIIGDDERVEKVQEMKEKVEAIEQMQLMGRSGAMPSQLKDLMQNQNTDMNQNGG